MLISLSKSSNIPVATDQDVFSVLREFNPWWSNSQIVGLPNWKRTVFDELIRWIQHPPSPRSVLISGARRVGKTVLMLQSIETLLDARIKPEQILYVTMDHPLLKLMGLDEVIRVWQKLQSPSDNVQYLFVDEVQVATGWRVWLKHQTDFRPNRRITATGSAIPIDDGDRESGVGRWHTIKIPTLSFREFLQIRKTPVPNLPNPGSLFNIHGWSRAERLRTAEIAHPLLPHFYDYIVRGGFPETAKVESVSEAQRLLREDIIDKVLKRDMTALYGVRHVLELEKVFLYLCLHDGGLFDPTSVSSSLGIGRQTVTNFLDLLESAHLIYRLRPFGYGKEVLRGKSKMYLADPAIAGSVLLRGRSVLEDSARLGSAVETAFFKHIFTHFYRASPSFTYWRGKKDHEVDVVAEVAGSIVPFEVKHKRGVLDTSDIDGLLELCRTRHVTRAYVITRDLDDFDTISINPDADQPTSILKLPAVLACFWLSNLSLDP